MQVERVKKGYDDRLKKADAHMNSKLLVIKQQEEEKEKRQQQMLQIPDIVRRSRERVDRMNEEGRLARMRASSRGELPKWSA